MFLCAAVQFERVVVVVAEVNGVGLAVYAGVGPISSSWRTLKVRWLGPLINFQPLPDTLIGKVSGRCADTLGFGNVSAPTRLLSVELMPGY